MFKKFLNNLLGNEEENKKKESAPYSAGTPVNQNLNEEVDEDDDEEDIEQYQFDPVTHHGMHYSKEDFDTAANNLYEQYLDGEDEPLSQQDKNNLKREAYRKVYMDWNGHDYDQLAKFEMANSLELTGYVTSGFDQVKEEGNPLYEPIHGISLYDYAAIAHGMTQGITEAELLKAFGIDNAVWGEVNVLWPERMKEDPTYGIMAKYGEYFAAAPQHPKLTGLAANIGLGSENSNLEKLKTDRYFYEELCGARTAAYEYGLDGAQWIVDNYGISLGDFQAVAMDWMTAQNQNFDSAKLTHYMDYQEQKRKEYAEKFAAEQGGNVADDIEF